MFSEGDCIVSGLCDARLSRYYRSRVDVPELEFKNVSPASAQNNEHSSKSYQT